MTPTAPIETHQLTCRFGSHTALAPLDLSIPRGSVYALVGHNGVCSSASTLQATITRRHGALPPSVPMVCDCLCLTLFWIVQVTQMLTSRSSL